MTPDAAAANATARLAAFLVRLERIDIEDLRLIALPSPHETERTRPREAAEAAAIEAGRHALVQGARVATRDRLDVAFARHQYDPTWVGLNWGRSMGPTEDRVALTFAAQDAAVGAVLEDVLDPDVLAELTEPFELAAGMAGSTPAPSESLERPGWRGRLTWIVLIVAVILIAIPLLLIVFGPQAG